MELGTRHKLIRPYTPRHHGKAARTHREDQRRLGKFSLRRAAICGYTAQDTGQCGESPKH